MMERLWNALLAMLLRARDEQAGQAYTEYGMVLVIIAIGVIGSLTLMGHQVTNMYQYVSNGLAQH